MADKTEDKYFSPRDGYRVVTVTQEHIARAPREISGSPVAIALFEATGRRWHVEKNGIYTPCDDEQDLGFSTGPHLSQFIIDWNNGREVAGFEFDFPAGYFVTKESATDV